MATKKVQGAPKLSDNEWLKFHRAEVDEMCRKLGYVEPSLKQIKQVVTHLRNEIK